MNSTGCTAKRKSRRGLKGSNRSNECSWRHPAGPRRAAVRGRRRDHGRPRRHRSADHAGRLFDQRDRSATTSRVEADSHDALGGLFLWINAGRLPLLILIILALGVFSIEGFLLQGIAHARRHRRAGRDRSAGGRRRQHSRRSGSPAAASPASSRATRPMRSATPISSARSREVSVGPLDQGLPGRVRLKDVFGNWHTVRGTRQSRFATRLPVGASVLLVDRDAKSFIAISAPADLIAHQRSSDRA